MLDTLLKPTIEPHLARAAKNLATSGMTADRAAAIAFVLGVVGCLAIGFQSYALGLILILAKSGIDALSVRISTGSDVSTKLRDTFNLFILCAFVFFFAIGQPHLALASAFMILTYAIMFIVPFTPAPSQDGFQIKTLIETSEPLIFMGLVCLTPDAFAAYVAIFAILCWITVAGRVWEIVKPKIPPPAV